MTLQPTLGQRLSALRHERRQTQAELARSVGVLQPCLADWEQGHHTPNLARCASLARALSVPLEALLCEDGYRPLACYVLSPDSLARLTHPATRQATLDELTQVLTSHIRAALEQAKPLEPVRHRDVRQRRTREQVLAEQSARLKQLAVEQKRKRAEKQAARKTIE